MFCLRYVTLYYYDDDDADTEQWKKPQGFNDLPTLSPRIPTELLCT